MLIKRLKGNQVNTYNYTERYGTACGSLFNFLMCLVQKGLFCLLMNTHQSQSRKRQSCKLPNPKRPNKSRRALTTLVLQKVVAPSGVLLSNYGVPKNPFAGSSGWPSKKYSYQAKVVFENENQAINGLNLCHTDVSKMHIFDPSIDKPTYFTFDSDKQTIEEDMRIAITTDIGIRYATSQERVSVYEYERDKSFVVCLSGCRANLIDGYYRIRGVRTDKIVYITYTKVQSLNGMLMKKMILDRDCTEEHTKEL